MTDETEDKGVSREIAGIQSGEFVRNGSPLVVAGLSKNWSRGSENKHIDKIFLHLDQTGVFCLIGANGSGKSTLMEMMAGKESADAGDILIMGSSIKTDRTLAWKHVGICNQGDSFWEQLNVEEHLLLFTRLKGAPRALENDIIVRYMISKTSFC
jgi:ABC-type multidrug transport system ATPase subunit